MLCYAIDQKPTSLGSPTSPEMYRNLQSESSTAPPSGFFQSNYPPKLGTASSYTSPNYSVLTSHPNIPEYPTSGISLDYQPAFIPSGHDVTTAQSAWGYSNPNFQSMLNTHPSWDAMGNGFHHPQTSTNAHYHAGLPPAPLVNGGSSPGSGTALTGIECFTTPPESATGIHVSSMHPGIPTQRRPYEWINKNAYQNAPPQQVGKTRTKDKYRVVYSDHQRLELEKEFRFSRYITIRRKAELAGQLCLSERQVKIWFQNRRAKERKASKKNGENSKQNDGDVIDEQDDADDDVSEHSGHGMTSSPTMMQHGSGVFAKADVHPGEQTFAIPEPQDGAMAHQLPPMSYSYGVHHSPQSNLHYEQMGSMAELKPIICNTEPHVLSPTDSTGTHQMRISPNCHQL